MDLYSERQRAHTLAASFGRARRGFSGSQNSPDNWSIQLVFALGNVAGVVLDAKDEHGEGSLFVECLLGDSNRQNTRQSVLAIGGFVTVFSNVPGEDAYLIVIVRQSVVGFGQKAQVLRNF